MLKQILSFLLAGHLMASTIPQYGVAAIGDKDVGLTNGASFEVQSNYRQVLLDWVIGDQLTIRNNDKKFVPLVIRSQNGLPFTVPVFILTNITRDSEVVAFPTLPPTGTSVAITSVNPQTGEVMLSDATAWTIMEENKERLLLWIAGDFVMIGINSDSSRSSFDAVIFNIARHTFVRAEEQ